MYLTCNRVFRSMTCVKLNPPISVGIYFLVLKVVLFYFIFFDIMWLTLISAAAAKSIQSCPTLCDPIDGSPLGSPIPGILQARTLEWLAISFSNAWKWKVKVKSLSRVRPTATPWTAAHQAPLSMGFSRQEYWSGLPLPSPLISASSEKVGSLKHKHHNVLISLKTGTS